MANSHKVKGSKPKSRKSILKALKRQQHNLEILKKLAQQSI